MKLLNRPWFCLVLQCAFLAVVVVFLVNMSVGRNGYPWQWTYLWNYLLTSEKGQLRLVVLLQALVTTLKMSAFALPLTLIFALLTALFRISSSPLLRGLALAYITLIRNTPLLVQLTFGYFVLAPFFKLEGFSVAVLSLSLFEGAYLAEILRAAILALPKTQWFAARSCGFGDLKMMTLVILPQAMLQVLPMLVNQLVSLVKDSALASTIGVYELTRHTKTLVAQTFLSFEFWLLAALCYLLVNLLLSLLGSLLEKRLARFFPVQKKI